MFEEIRNERFAIQGDGAKDSEKVEHFKTKRTLDSLASPLPPPPKKKKRERERDLRFCKEITDKSRAEGFIKITDSYTNTHM
jgi:hypothetical protein